GIVTYRLGVGTIAARGTEIIHPMHHQVGGATLTREAEVVRIELMPVEAKTKFHNLSLAVSKRGLSTKSSGEFVPARRILDFVLKICCHELGVRPRFGEIFLSVCS